MSLSLFAASPLPVMTSLWNAANQSANIPLASFTPHVADLRQRLDESGFLGMSPNERVRVQSALDHLEREIVTRADASGCVPRLLLAPMLDTLASALPVRLAYRGGDSEDIGREFCIGEEIGQGGCSRVYHGYSLETGVTVAIKLADASDSGVSDDLVQAVLRREYEILSRLPEGVGPRVMRFGTMQGRPCLVMEYLMGQDLHDSITDLQHDLNTPDALRRLMGIGVQAVQSIAAMHERGIVHRDIKPENFRIRTVRVTGREVRAFDFGIARFAGESDTITMGTPSYMSPESFNPDVPADPRRDVFALGATLYQLITGETPFPGDDVNVIVRKMMDPGFRPFLPSTLLLENRPELKGQVSNAWLNLMDTIILKALDRDPARRYANAGEMLKSLRLLMGGRIEAATVAASLPARVAPPSPVARARSSTRNDSPNGASRAARRGGSG